MKTKDNKLKGKIFIILLTASMFLLFGTFQGHLTTVQAFSGNFDEDFTTTTYMDGAETNITGWGTGSVENSRKKPTIVGSISSALIGNIIDVFVDGDIAYVTNQDEGLKVVNITDSTNPFVISSYDTDSIAQSVYVDGDYVFIADYQGITPQFKNFIILNVTDLTNPVKLGDCSTNLFAGDAAHDVVVDGDIAYVANGGGGLCVIDVSIPSSPEVKANKNTPGTSYDLVVEGDYVYLADGSNGLVVLNVTDPLTPTIAANYTTGLSDAINVVVDGNYAFVVDFNNGIVVVDITDPTTPTFAGSLSRSSLTGASIYGDFLYITDLIDGLSVVNITDQTNIELVNTISLPGSTQSIFIEGCYAYIASFDGGFQIVKIADFSPPTYVEVYPEMIRDVFVSGDFAYLARDTGLTEGPNGLLVLDISDPSSPFLTDLYLLPDRAFSVVVSGDYAYVADYMSGLQVLDISDPSSLTPAGSYNTPGIAVGIFISGDYAYVADGATLQVLDISDPSSPTFTGSYPTPSFAYDVVVSGDFAYVTHRTSGLLVLDISDPSSPTFAGSFTTAFAMNVFVSGDYAYVADYDSLQVLDISVPSSPTLAGSYPTPSEALDVFVSGDFAYVADSESGLQVLDISDPSSPTFAGSYDTTGGSWNIFVSGDFAYVADYGGGLLVLEVRKNRARQFASPCVAQSNNVVSANTATFTSAVLIANDSLPTSTSITYSLSADGGSNWETISEGVEHIFSSTGGQLKWKAFQTTSDVSVSPLIHNLSIDYTTTLVAPSLDTPTDSYITDDYTPTFTWFGINGESNFLFQLDTSASFTALLLNLTLPSSSTSYTPSSPLTTDTYYWRVAGIDSEGDIGDFSNYRTLNLISDVNPPTIDNPIDVSYEQGTTGNSITWVPADSNPYWYNITLNGILTSHDDSWLGSNIVMNIDGLALGTHTVICYVYDLEGLVTSDTVEIEVVTTAPPTIDDVADFPYEEGTTGNSITWHPSDANPDYYSITRNGLVIDDGPWLGGDINIDIDGLVYGVYTYICFVNDTEGQSNSDSVTITVTDIVIPILNSPGDVIYAEEETGNNIIWIATDSNPSTYIVYKDGILYDSDTWTSGSSIIISVDGLSSSQYNFTIVVEDQAGNSAKDTVIVGVTAAVPEFNNTLFLSILNIVLVIVLYYTRRRYIKKS